MAAAATAPAKIGLLGIGHMGAGLGAELVGAGFQVGTVTAGRSAHSRERAEAAGIQGLPDLRALVAWCDTFLSVVPADQAEPLAAQVGEVLGAEPLHYVDCNSIAPSRTRRVAAAVTQAGVVFSDGGIIGAPPGEGRAATRLYVSGPEAGMLAALQTQRLTVTHLGDGLTRATDMKILFAAANKGAVALMANVLAGAERAGLTEAVIAELQATRPGLLAGVQGHAPELPMKAARWAIEMEDVAAGLADLGAQPGYHQAAAEGYRGLAERLEDHDDTDALTRVLRAWSTP